jgi:hypothetical protein
LLCDAVAGSHAALRVHETFPAEWHVVRFLLRQELWHVSSVL